MTKNEQDNREAYEFFVQFDELLRRHDVSMEIHSSGQMLKISRGYEPNLISPVAIPQPTQAQVDELVRKLFGELMEEQEVDEFETMTKEAINKAARDA